MQTITLSVRVPKAEADRWKQLAHDAGMDRATLLKQALRTGCVSALFERACAAYRRGDITLARAAESTGLSLREMLLRMPQADLNLHYSVRDLEKDLEP
jgi:hypothetical protein